MMIALQKILGSTAFPKVVKLQFSFSLYLSCHFSVLPLFHVFSLDTCALQVLCIELQAVLEPNRWRLIDAVTKWLVAVVSLDRAAPPWILSAPDDRNLSHTHCCTTLMSMLVSLLWDGFEMLQEIIEQKGKLNCFHSVQIIAMLYQVVHWCRT